MHKPVRLDACPFQIGERFERTFVFDADGISAFASMAGDMNPLHHDPAAAAASRFNGMTASGTHTTSIMLGTLATLVSGRGSAVGLEFSVKLKKAISAGEAQGSYGLRRISHPSHRLAATSSPSAASFSTRTDR